MKRLIALLLAVVMVAGMLPAAVLAAGNAPTNVQWYSGAYLMGTWEPPADDGRTYRYDVAIYYSEDPDGPWENVQFYSDWEKDNAYALDSSTAAENGSGYYKFAVCCNSDSCDGESDWAQSDPIYLDLSSGSKGTISAPLSGSFDPVSGALSWSDAEDIDSNPQRYMHRAVVEMWYTGANGELPQEDWEMVKCGQVGGFIITGTNMSDFVYAGDLADMENGRYVFTVSNLADDYCWRGMSQPALLDGYYDHVKPDLPALDAPTGLCWTENGINWDSPYDMGLEIGNLGSFTFELTFSVQKPVGYDGIVIGLNSTAVDARRENYLHDVYQADQFLLFRIPG